MIRAAVKRTLVTELYSWPAAALVIGILCSLGLLAARHASFAEGVIGLAVAVIVWRVKFGRW